MKSRIVFFFKVLIVSSSISWAFVCKNNSVDTNSQFVSYSNASEKLVLYDNSTFSYIYKNYPTHVNSTGKWSKIDNEIVLISAIDRNAIELVVQENVIVHEDNVTFDLGDSNGSEDPRFYITINQDTNLTWVYPFMAELGGIKIPKIASKNLGSFKVIYDNPDAKTKLQSLEYYPSNKQANYFKIKANIPATDSYQFFDQTPCVLIDDKICISPDNFGIGYAPQHRRCLSEN